MRRRTITFCSNSNRRVSPHTLNQSSLLCSALYTTCKIKRIMNVHRSFLSERVWGERGDKGGAFDDCFFFIYKSKVKLTNARRRVQKKKKSIFSEFFFFKLTCEKNKVMGSLFYDLSELLVILIRFFLGRISF